MREVNNGPGCLRGPCRIDGFLKECEFNFLYRATEERVKAILEALGNKESRLVAGPQERPVPILHRGLTEPGDLPLCFPSVTSSRSLTARIFLAASSLLAFASEVVFNPRVLTARARSSSLICPILALSFAAVIGPFPLISSRFRSPVPSEQDLVGRLSPPRERGLIGVADRHERRDDDPFI